MKRVRGYRQHVASYDRAVHAPRRKNVDCLLHVGIHLEVVDNTVISFLCVRVCFSNSARLSDLRMSSETLFSLMSSTVR
jgi:hypothetical protein